MLDLEYIRSKFPALSAHPREGSNEGWAFFDNAGGSLAPRSVIEAVQHYMSHYQMQVGADYPASQAASQAMLDGRKAIARLMRCHEDEVVLNGSTTLNVYLLADALRPKWKAGDVVVISQVDHEANRGAWQRLKQHGIVVREWKLHQKSQSLRWEDLKPLLDDRVRLVSYTQCANILGQIHNIRDLNQKIHEAGAEVCVDGVAYAPHRALHPKDWGCDYYLWSIYKVYGPHLGAMYAPREKMLALSNRNHPVVPEDAIPYKMQPGNVNHELCAGLSGVFSYLEDLAAHHGMKGRAEAADADAGADGWLDPLFEAIAQHEEQLSAPLLHFLQEHPKVSVYGPSGADQKLRVPTIAFRVADRSPAALAHAMQSYGIALRHGCFYAQSGVEALGVDPSEGLIRVSLVHYNEEREVSRLIDALAREL